MDTQTLKDINNESTQSNQGKKPLLTTAIIFNIITLVAITGSAYYLITKNNNQSDNNQNANTTQSSDTMQDTDLILKEDENKNLIAQTENPLKYTKVSQERLNNVDDYTVYLGSYDGDYILYQDNHSGYDKTKFTPLNVIFNTTKDQTVWVDGYIVDEQSNTLYFNLLYTDPGSEDSYPNHSTLYAYNFKTNERATILSKTPDAIEPVTFFDGNTLDSKTQGGVLKPEKIIDHKYLVLRFAQCYACDEVGPGLAVLLDLSTFEYTVLPEVGDFKYDEETHTLSYKTYEYDDSNCNANQIICTGEYKTTGKAGSIILK